MGLNGKYLSEENVTQMLVRFAVPHPDLTMVDRMKDIGSKQALPMKKNTQTGIEIVKYIVHFPEAIYVFVSYEVDWQKG